MVSSALSVELRPYLISCGYVAAHLVADVELPSGYKVPLAAFAVKPFDARSACIAVIDGMADPRSNVDACRELGAPLVFVRISDAWQLWKQGTVEPEHLTSVAPNDLGIFFQRHGGRLFPESIYRAKTWGRFEQSLQLDFVDLGLMPLLEEEVGSRLTALFERIVLTSRAILGWKEISAERREWLLQANFWLIAGKILRDKGVPEFANLDLSEFHDVFRRVAQHYGAAIPLRVGDGGNQAALHQSAYDVSRFGNLQLVSMEALAYIYENALTTKETRPDLAIHSTPTYLVEYITGKLRPWIESIPMQERFVFEPACGHAAFLASAMRLLRDLRSADPATVVSEQQYLRAHLSGIDIDPLALEIARLSLTLADVPHPNGWRLAIADALDRNAMQDRVRAARIVLANPPFESLSPSDRRVYAAHGREPYYTNKAAEILRLIVENLEPYSVFGIVLPQSVLDSRKYTSLRRKIADEFDVIDISLFPDSVFRFSDLESAVLLARRVRIRHRLAKTFSYSRVREPDMEEFRRSYISTISYTQPTPRLCESDHYSFIVPELDEVWQFLSGLDTLDDVAEVGQGLSFIAGHNSRFPEGAVTCSQTYRPEFMEGFTGIPKTVQTHELPNVQWLNLDPAVIARPRHGTRTGVAQVLLNYAPASRKPWRHRALIDPIGRAITSRIIAIRPTSARWSVEATWALLNSPIANAYTYAFGGKRDIPVGLLRRMRVPQIVAGDLRSLESAVKNYFAAARRGSIGREHLRNLHWRVDAEVLNLYALPLQLEVAVLNLFSGVRRLGVPFPQDGYFPDNPGADLRLGELLNVIGSWPNLNNRRSELILREIEGSLSIDDAQELETLQRLADVKLRLEAPLPLKQLRSLRDHLKREEEWAIR